MSTIKDILTISLDEEIKSVIDLNSQDEGEIVSELNGFILTESLAKHLNEFCEEYVNGTMQSGIWLSGFYGSGKSYFAKMLGFLLKNPTLQGTTMRERFAPKLIGLPNADFIQNNVNALDRFESHVVLFDSAKSTSEFGMPYMLFSNFLRSLNLLDNWIGILEYNLLLDGKYDQLLQTVQEIEGESWFVLRKIMTRCHSVFKKAMLQMGNSEEEYNDSKSLAEQYRNGYDATKLREDLARYIEKNPQTRIVFMIDEVSEAIIQEKINLLDLEGIAEALASLGRKVWTIAIAQLKLDDVISMKNVSSNQLTKVRDRFRTTIDIKAEEVDVIIKQRLLDKVDGAREDLKEYFQNNSGAIRDLTNLPGLNLRPTVDADTYADYYPFHEYQFRMLQYFLFGSSEMVQTKVGTRGMIISAFDVLKKEVKRDYHEHAHVTATQLCNQAELTTEEEQAIRYEQAENALSDKGYQIIDGKKLLQTIHFLAKTEVTQTTAENICRAYIDGPERYYDALAEIKSALEVLLENQIVLLSGNQYRITNQTEQRILDDMRNFDVLPFVIRSEVTKSIKALPAIRNLQTRNVESINVPFQIMREDGESILGNPSELKVLLHDINVVNASERTQYINRVKQDSNDQKGQIHIVPSTDFVNEITALVTDIKRIEYITQKQFTTDEEKRIVNSFALELDQKYDRLDEYLMKSYCEGTAVYCYNSSSLNQMQFDNTIKNLQLKAHDNIYTKRLSSRLNESLAPRVITENAGSLHTLFGPSDDFKFFDSSGTFIGNTLAVTTEIITKASSYISGSELERQLSAPPTGYQIGTIMGAVAALFRGNKMIARYNGTEYHSVHDNGVVEIFRNTRNFGRASFKAVAQGLTYNQRTEIIDILKDDCNYRQWTGDSVSYQFNDFDVVNAIRDLSKEVISRLNNEIASDDRLSQLFSTALQAKTMLQPFTAQVNEGNCVSQARAFINQQDDYIAAVERVDDALDFINRNFETIEKIRLNLGAIKDEMQQAGSDMRLINPIVEQFQQCYENNMVSNYQNILNIAQQARDLYFRLFEASANQVTEIYSDLRVKADDVRQQLNAYPQEWNLVLINKIKQFDDKCKRYIINDINIPQYEVRCRRCGFQLRDLAYAQNMANQCKQEITMWQTEIVTSDPTPPPSPSPGEPQPQPNPQPKRRAMRSTLPSGEYSVQQYRQWLTDQLALISNFDATDKLDFNN